MVIFSLQKNKWIGWEVHINKPWAHFYVCSLDKRLQIKYCTYIRKTITSEGIIILWNISLLYIDIDYLFVCYL